MPVWGVARVDPGYLYVIKSERRYKLGKTASALRRLRAAKTWLPDMELLGYKPFWGISHHERLLHIGLAPNWYSGEWFDFADDHDARDYFLDGFRAFSDDDPDRNSVDFIYWYNEGMVEFRMEMSRQGRTLPKFHRQESGTQKI